MEQIYPLREEVISQYCGMPVCVVFKTGFKWIGVLKACQGGKLILSDRMYSGGLPVATADETSSIRKQSASRKKNNAKAAGLRQSTTKYASKGQNPASFGHNYSEEDFFKAALDEVAFLLLIV